VHFGGGVSGHIKLVPKFLSWVEQGYKVYTDVTWAVGFGVRWLLTEIERRGVGHDRVLFASYAGNEVTVSTAERIATRGFPRPTWVNRSIAFWMMSRLASRSGKMLMAASVMKEVLQSETTSPSPVRERGQG
jgi:hypothetical protein